VRKKGIARFIFLIVFLLPITWYLILQLFGSNRFQLNQLQEIPTACGQFQSITIILKQDSLSLTKQNYLQRVAYGAKKRAIEMVDADVQFFECLERRESDIALVSEKGLFGMYTLSREGVDQFLTELDVLILQNSYGKGTSR